ncbi:MAG: hypothetical protein H7X91_08045 [Burkholderiales bacterium]|nr:hypothetical protein [Burkholderiales bacterium]
MLYESCWTCYEHKTTIGETMRTKTLTLLVAPIFLLALSACDSPQKDVADAKKEVVKEQREADREIGAAKKDVVEEKREAMDKTPMTPDKTPMTPATPPAR